MARTFILLLLFSWGISLHAQEIVLSGRIINAATEQPLAGATISKAGSTLRGTVSNNEGFFTFKVDSLPVTLIVSSLGFEQTQVYIQDQNPLVIGMVSTSIELAEIIVSGTPKIDTVYQEPYNVVDYLFKDSFLILLVYKNVFEKYQLVLLDQNEAYLDHYSLRDYQPQKLFKSCFSEAYLSVTGSVYTINIQKQSISLGDRIEEEYFDNIIEPCVLYSDNMLYYQRHLYQGQALRYYAFHENQYQQDSLCILPLIEDEANIIRLIEETGNKLPWSGDLWDTDVSERLVNLREGNYFLKGAFRMFYPKLYAPLVKKDSSLCLFNHFASTIQYFDKNGKMQKEVRIKYHKRKRWKKYILYDSFTENAYTAFHSKWGEYVCQIDMETGKLSSAIPLDLDFIDKVTIRNGTMYFLHRDPYRGATNRMIQKVRLQF